MNTIVIGMDNIYALKEDGKYTCRKFNSEGKSLALEKPNDFNKNIKQIIGWRSIYL